MKPNELIASLKKLSLVKKVGPRPKIGLDIEPTSLALVEFSGGLGSQLQLKAASLLGIGKNILTSEEVRDKEALTEAISKIKLLSHCKTKTISINAPGTLVVTKEVTMPTNIEENDWEYHARNEAKKLFPGLESNLLMDFTIYETEKANKKVNNMLLIAARKKELEERIDAISKGGLQTEVVDIDYYALERAYPLIIPQLPPEHVDQHVALLHIDTTAMLMNVIHHQETEYTHRQTYNGESIASAIQKYLELDMLESSSEKETKSDETISENKTANQTISAEKTAVKTPEASSPKSTDEKKDDKFSSEALEKIEVKKPSQALKADTVENLSSEKNEIKKSSEETEDKEAIKPEQAAKVEITKTTDEGSSIDELTSYRDQLVSRIEKFIQYYYSDASHKKLDFLVLSGRCAIIPDLAKNIEEKIGVTTILANPFVKVKVPKAEKGFIDKSAPIFMLSCGLALRGVN